MKSALLNFLCGLQLLVWLL